MRKTRWGWAPALVLVVAAATGLAGCTSAASTSSGGSADSAAPGPDALNGKGEVDITFWHAMSGTNGQTLQTLTNQFNQQNKGKIKVTLNYKGQYDAALASYKNASAAQRPDIMQMYDIGTRYMIDSGSTIPIQSFIDEDKYNTADLQPAITGYYTVDNKLDSMPFNTSMPLLYINKEAFQKAGLDPNKPPTTLDEIMTDAQKIKATPGETVQYGFGATIYGWYVEQWNAIAGQTLCNADNGRTGRASAVTLTTPTTTKVLQWWQTMINQGLAEKLDNNTDNGDSAFSSGTVAIGLESTGELGDFTKGAASAKNPFTVGTGYFPKVDASDSGGPIIGGASNWIIKKSPAEERASWEYIKFLSSQQSQVTWHTSTGYFPIVKSALTDPTDQSYVASKPQFETAIKQLQATPLTHATQGCSVGEMPDVRKDVENAWEAAALQNKDVTSSLNTAQTTANKQISDYNAKLPG